MLYIVERETDDNATYVFECDDCGEMVFTPSNDMQGARCEDVAEKEDLFQCPGEMQLIDTL